MIAIYLDGSAAWRSRIFSFWDIGVESWILEPRDWRWHLRQVGWRPWMVRSQQGRIPAVALAMPPRWLASGWPFARLILTSAVTRIAQGNDYVLVLSSPDYVRLLPHLAVHPSALIYYAYDDYRANRPHEHELIESREHELLERADLVIAAAQYRAERFRTNHPLRADRIFHVPVGVDPLFLNAIARHRDLSHPDMLPAWSRPRFLYFGALTGRTDFRCFAEVAERFPEGAVILAGRPPSPMDGSPAWWREAESTLRRPNVHVLGWVDEADIAGHLMSADVLLMAHTDCAFNRGSCPAKLWDYLATGRPIVATPHCPEVNLFPNLVYFGEADSSYGAAAACALEEQGDVLAWERQDIAYAHSRDRLGQRVAEYLARELSHG